MKFSLYYPVKPLYITQKFGETSFLQYYKDHGINFAGHNGLDMVTKHGDPVYASHDGVAYYEVDNSQGHGVVIRSNEMFDYKGGKTYFKTIYWHLCDETKEPQYKSPVANHRNLTKSGMPVKAGDLIGYADSTGLSTGDHLHFGLKPCLPGESDWIFSNIEQNNGYQGAIDPEPYFNGKFAEDIKSFIKPFDYDMSYRSNNSEITRLQLFLKQLGYFPKEQGATGFYGDITRNSVYHFQLDHVKMTPWETLVLAGRKVGPKTRIELNKLIN